MLGSLRKNHGFSLMDIVFAAALSSVIALILLSSVTQSKVLVRRSVSATGVSIARGKIFQMLHRFPSFERTVTTAGQPFNCLLSRAGCPAGWETNTFKIYDELGVLFYDPTTQGFTSDGIVCTADAPIVPTVAKATEKCPIVAILEWNPVCSTCSPGSAYFRLRFSIYDYATKTITSKDGYGFTFLKSFNNIACSGTLVGGFCWYLGTAGQSCDTVCATHGGYHAATEYYAGSSGLSNLNCEYTMDGLLGSYGNAPTVFTPCAAATGCGRSGGVIYRCTGAVTTSSASSVGMQRACACQN